ncbi:hypothetical protein EAI26_09590 [Lactobacillus sp. 0.1XD8-4]|uniref:hypothetical protein n=1 Tax=uncultured Limosilactobacillus sp. TaxID=2837629 RepID=UPI00129EBE6F|nr:hypothetical protein [uncultured Limosilactobacillus sp.]MRN07627.1 hypothetical protein [Lactobacillus sp. 0.1XD8-4]
MRRESENDNRVQLTLAKQQGTLIEVHNLPNDDYFNVGFVVALDPVFCLMISIDWDGKINGLIAIRIKSILYTERHSDYLTAVSEKTKVAHDYGYFDIWQVQKFIDDHPEMMRGDLLSNLLTDSFTNKLPVVIGTDKYKGRDDFTGVITELNAIKLTLHYFNEHDLSSLWEYDILRAKIDYLRVRGAQMATGRQILQDIFKEL